MATIPPPKEVINAGINDNKMLINPSRTGTKPLQFMVDPDFHREFKILAMDKGKTMSELFLDMYSFYKRS
tara:strand:- start:723 stop:932 length:210 start_codon:yes stop_codon:yes gene_type:complete